MSLENRYGVSKEVINKMVREGTIPCSVVRQHEILDRFKQMKSEDTTLSNLAIFRLIGDELNVSEKTIEKIVYTLQKRL